MSEWDWESERKKAAANPENTVTLRPGGWTKLRLTKARKFIRVGTDYLRGLPTRGKEDETEH